MGTCGCQVLRYGAINISPVNHSLFPNARAGKSCSRCSRLNLEERKTRMGAVILAN
jgi:hypothetical protein